MKSGELTEAYHSPLRQAQTAATRERILDAFAELTESGVEPTYASVAERAQVQERTVYRHFPTKTELHQAFWQRLHAQRLQVPIAGSDLDSLLEQVAQSFRAFGENEPLVRALLHSEHGQQIRMDTNEQRRRRLEQVVGQELPELDRGARRRTAAAVHILSSASAWEYLHDYWGMSAEQAAACIQTALHAMLRGLATTPPTRKPRTRTKKEAS